MRASDLAIEESEEWLTFAKSVVSDRADDPRVIIRLFSEGEPPETERLRDEFRSEIEQQIASSRALTCVR